MVAEALIFLIRRWQGNLFSLAFLWLGEGILMTRSDVEKSGHGHGTGIPHPVDVYVGKRIRMGRVLRGMTMATLAARLELARRQLQNYEAGAQRVSASRLAAIADTLCVPIEFFFEALDGRGQPPSETAPRERTQTTDTIELIRLYYAIRDPNVRHQLLAMAKAIAEASRAARRA
jgi:transcriptional regulator with XRE-family HTH domain